MSALRCEIGNHEAKGAIYRAKPGDKWGCSPCIIKALGATPKWLGNGR